MIAPKFQQLAEKDLDVVFMKLDCNQENKVCGSSLIVLFHLFAALKQADGIANIAVSSKRAGNQGCSHLQDSQGQQSGEGSNGRQI